MSSDHHAQVPRIPPEDVRLLWVNDWYDAPFEAVVEHGGQRCLLRLSDVRALDGELPARWMLHPLDDAQRAAYERWHEAYVRDVGAHWCFHDEPHASVAAEPGAPRQADSFLVAHHNRAPIDLASLAPAHGWLEALPLR